jgi:hypothetical protein
LLKRLLLASESMKCVIFYTPVATMNVAGDDTRDVLQRKHAV